MLPAIIIEHYEEIARLCRRHSVRRLELFGSAATGKWDPESSDLDFIVKFDETDNGLAYVRLQEQLAEVFGRDIDLIADQEHKNPYFRRSVEASRTHLWGERRQADSLNGAHMTDGQGEHPALKYLWDIREECEYLRDVASASTLEDVLDSKTLTRAVLHSVTLIGEQLNALRRIEPVMSQRITDVGGYVGQRNIIVHIYYDINWEKVWHTVTVEAPRLLTEVEALIAELDPQERG